MTYKRAFWMLVISLISFCVGYAAVGTSPAQSVNVQRWTYGMYVTGIGDDALHQWHEFDEEAQKTIQDIIALEENPNIVSVFHLIGLMGWEYTGINKVEPLTLYIFKRPTE